MWHIWELYILSVLLYNITYCQMSVLSPGEVSLLLRNIKLGLLCNSHTHPVKMLTLCRVCGSSYLSTSRDIPWAVPRDTIPHTWLNVTHVFTGMMRQSNDDFSGLVKGHLPCLNSNLVTQYVWDLPSSLFLPPSLSLSRSLRSGERRKCPLAGLSGNLI